MIGMPFDTLTQALETRRNVDRELILIDGEDVEVRRSFAQLHARALALLGQLQRRGLRQGDCLVLFVSDNRAFLEMFWACLLGGIVAVPVAVGGSDAHRDKLFGIIARLREPWLFTEAQTLARLQRHAAEGEWDAAAAVLAARALELEHIEVQSAPGTPAAVARDDIAFIQFSSGSTSTPKGVVLTHHNIMANIAGIAEAAAFSDADIALSWMPLTHDMGLIGFHLHMLVQGITHAIMRTDLFARRPLIWLRKASELRATVLCSPNFGYQHTLKQYLAKRPADIDLSAVRLIFNGAEPISAALAQRFVQTMAAHGLAANAMFPVYGLAEASLAVSFPRPGAPMQVCHLDRDSLRIGAAPVEVAAGDPRASDFVLLGTAIPGTELRLVGDDGTTLAQGLLGHVQIRGDNVTAGYHADPEANAAALAEQGWLYTGDVGFVAADGQLVITGRAKDIIFVNGQNYYPHDLEALAEGVPGIETNRVVAVGARLHDHEQEQIVVFLLHRGSLEDFVPLARAVRRLLNQQTGLEIARVLPVGRIPKTTSGKLQRHLLKQGFERGEYSDVEAQLLQLMPEFAAVAELPSEVVATEGLPEDTREALLHICGTVIPDKQVALDTDLFEINLDSITLARLHEAIDALFPGRVDVTDLFDYPTLADLADFIDEAA